MFSPNQSANRISVARSDKNRAPYVPQKQLEQQKSQKQPYCGPENSSGEESIGIRLPRLLNTGTQSSTTTATNRLPLPPPPLPPPQPRRSATTSISLIPLSYHQRIAEQDTPSDQQLTSEFLEIRLDAVSKPCWVQASLSIFTKQFNNSFANRLFSSFLYFSY